jgi:glycosyltransferase involved in cell wall biosynthesis
MEKIADDKLSIWETEGSVLIKQNFEVFRSLVTQTKDYAECGDYTVAAVYAQMAALYAFWRHSGLFNSPELEQVLCTIGQQAIPIYPRKNEVLPGSPRKVLHVASAVQGIGGLGRMIWRWIQQDTESCHSLVLTQQASSHVPNILREALHNSGGNIHSLNESTIGGILSWAKRLRQIAASADIVVLHIWPDDTIPIIAFANKEQSPPILFLDHADHGFWLGASITDVVINLRFSGMRLSQDRRGFEAERIAILPIILPPTQRKLSRTEAKQKLGLEENSVVLLSIARAPKYKTIDKVNFADAHIPLLSKYNNAVLVVIGPGNSENWSAAVEQTQGRIKIFSEREDTAVFYQAADIYVDSFPIASNTSLLEAGSYGLPLITRYPYSDACSIIGGDSPGIDGNLLRARNLEEYTAILSRLVENEELRLTIGEETRKCIVEIHMESNWQKSLEDIYTKATTLPKITVKSQSKDEMFLGEPDVLLTRVYWHACGQGHIDPENLKKWCMMPFPQRFVFWIKLIKKHGLRRKASIDILLPQWLYCQLRKYAINLKKIIRLA